MVTSSDGSDHEIRRRPDATPDATPAEWGDVAPMPTLPDFIPGSDAGPGTDGADPDAAGLDAPCLLAAEALFLRSWRGSPEADDDTGPRTGIALSGGGVRSAAFALGVMQVLAERRLLERFDYMSSVSGGGFMAGALVWLLGPSSPDRFGTGPDDLAFGAEPASDADADAARGTPLLNFLRQHGAYLMPGHGITPISAIAVVLRGILLNLTVWLPILVATMLLLFAASEPFDGNLGISTGAPIAFDALLWAAIGFGLLFLAGSLLYSFSTHSRWNVRRKRYLVHRRYETRMAWILGPLMVLCTLASLPWAADASLGIVGQFGGAAFIGIGLAIGLWSFLRPDGSWGVAFVRKRALPIGALLALYGVLLFAYQSALWLHDEATTLARGVAGALLLIAVASGRFVNLNYISVQRYYRDRLMEVFMPDIDRTPRPQGGPAPQADGQRLSTCLSEGRRDGPYPLFNTHAPFSAAANRRRRLRGGDNFILSPLYCGSASTGWRRTGQFMDDGMTLPTAMAISGSVNHQQSGLGGVGIALNPLVSLLKVLLNLRMGYWVPNPGHADQARRPNHFAPGLAEALAIGRDEQDPFVLLEDGGHFDNLGLYELVRRRLRLILVCDAGADAGARLSDLHRVLRRAELDFGARTTFEDEQAYLDVVPDRDASYPEGGSIARRAHLIGRLRYADGTTGTLIYLKSALVPGMRFSELGYGSRRKGFPQESTVDQFFDEEQFDAHRRLGCELARRLIGETGFEQRLNSAHANDTVADPGRADV